MRCFLAIDLPEELKSVFGETQKEFAKYARIKLVEHENLHITLKFFGEVDETALNTLRKAFSLLRKEKPFEIVFQDLGAFPDKKYVRVIWVDIVGLDDLQEKITKTAEKAGFGSKREEKPHLTLGRVKSVSGKGDFRKALEERKEFGRMVVKELKLKKSVLTEKGPVYEDVEVFKLGD